VSAGLILDRQQSLCGLYGGNKRRHIFLIQQHRGGLKLMPRERFLAALVPGAGTTGFAAAAG
jgi:hypothetical protein